MSDQRTTVYAKKLSCMISKNTVSCSDCKDTAKFREFHELLRKLFPDIFSCCEFEDHSGSFVMRWKGKSDAAPILLMNHHDVVEAPGKWDHDPFSGDICDGRLWGRGTLDDKGGLFAMLEAADELAKVGFVPKADIYFMSTCNEETDSKGAKEIANIFEKRGLRFRFSLDEGGLILNDPIVGAKGMHAMVGMGEKGCADIKFTARSSGGHASIPAKNTPLIRLAKFMADVEKTRAFKAHISPTLHEMFKRLSSSMHGPLKFVLGHSKFFAPILSAAIPKVSAVCNAMLKTTIAFTMAQGSDGPNVLPEEAWVIGNMRYSAHQGKQASIEAVTKLAAKSDIETHVIDSGMASPVTDHKSDEFKLIEKAIDNVFGHIKTIPYIMLGASDSCYISKVCNSCLRFTPFYTDDQQFASLHGKNENVYLSSLIPAVDFFRYIITEA